MSYKWIRASEITEYVYCRRAWWLKQARGVQTRNVRQLQQGTQFHRQHGSLVRRSTWMRNLAYALLFCVVALLVFRLVIGG